CQHHNNYPYSF
nr:immunoglobulin light chain junction region [Macaca mulatta]MOW74083.1 immunoglobulin light chain junction region [Macaca mulatta]MOX57647.1 immunoglobulin light chain junction region [Macaca mulatta]MOX90886.1 immunoglobulin light chain junction region [Macaca mulatta]